MEKYAISIPGKDELYLLTREELEELQLSTTALLHTLTEVEVERDYFMM